MAHWNDAAVTQDGIALLNEMMAGQELILTKACGGTGKVESSSLGEQTSLLEEKQVLSLVDEMDSPDGKTVTVQISSIGNEAEYLLQQIGVYAKLGADGVEKLLFVMQDDGVLIPAESDKSFLLEIYCALKIGQNGKLSVNIDQSGIVTSERLQKELDKHRTLSGNENPTPETVGTIGQHYFNTETKKDFTCVAINETGYVWEVSGANIAGDITCGGRALTEILGDISPASNSGIPTSSTAGIVGQKYVNTDSGAVYTCIAAELPEGADAMRYTWVPGSLGTLEEIRAALSNKVDLSLISNDNILDNAYFVGGGSQQGGGQFPINQRGQTVYNGNWTYGVDRWLSYGQVSLVESGLKLDNTSTSSYPINFHQRFEQSRVVQGEVYTASMLLANGELVAESGVITFDVQEHQRMFGGDRLYVARDTGTLGVVVTTVGPGQNEIIAAMKFELGPIQTLAHKDASGNWALNDPPPNFALELEKCKRYQLVLGHSVYAPIGMFVQSIPNQLACYIQIPISLCTKPVVSTHGTFRVIGPNENKLVSFTISDGGNLSDNGIIVGLVPSVEISSDVGWIDTADAQSYVLIDRNL